MKKYMRWVQENPLEAFVFEFIIVIMVASFVTCISVADCNIVW